MSFLLAHLLSWSTLLLVIDALLWHLAPFKHRVLRVGVRLAPVSYTHLTLPTKA